MYRIENNISILISNFHIQNLLSCLICLKFCNVSVVLASSLRYSEGYGRRSLDSKCFRPWGNIKICLKKRQGVVGRGGGGGGGQGHLTGGGEED